jgi:hypothetical protein
LRGASLELIVRREAIYKGEGHTEACRDGSPQRRKQLIVERGPDSVSVRQRRRAEEGLWVAGRAAAASSSRRRTLGETELGDGNYCFYFHICASIYLINSS